MTVDVDPTGLVAAYGFEETSGTSTTDRSGKNNTGTISGATRSTSGRFGSALSVRRRERLGHGRPTPRRST